MGPEQHIVTTEQYTQALRGEKCPTDWDSA
jgi:hypothetical protein